MDPSSPPAQFDHSGRSKGLRGGITMAGDCDGHAAHGDGLTGDLHDTIHVMHAAVASAHVSPLCLATFALRMRVPRDRRHCHRLRWSVTRYDRASVARDAAGHSLVKGADAEAVAQALGHRGWAPKILRAFVMIALICRHAVVRLRLAEPGLGLNCKPWIALTCGESEYCDQVRGED